MLGRAEAQALGIPALPLAIFQHPLGGLKPEMVEKRAQSVVATIQHVIVPQAAADYYGPNEAHRVSLEQAGNTWRAIHRRFRSPRSWRSSRAWSRRSVTRSHSPWTGGSPGTPG